MQFLFSIISYYEMYHQEFNSICESQALIHYWHKIFMIYIYSMSYVAWFTKAPFDKNQTKIKLCFLVSTLKGVFTHFFFMTLLWFFYLQHVFHMKRRERMYKNEQLASTYRWHHLPVIWRAWFLSPHVPLIVHYNCTSL